jgi:hypothetical protein
MPCEQKLGHLQRLGSQGVRACGGPAKKLCGAIRGLDRGDSRTEEFRSCTGTAANTEIEVGCYEKRKILVGKILTKIAGNLTAEREFEWRFRSRDKNSRW